TQTPECLIEGLQDTVRACEDAVAAAGASLTDRRERFDPILSELRSILQTAASNRSIEDKRGLLQRHRDALREKRAGWDTDAALAGEPTRDAKAWLQSLEAAL